MAYPVLADLQNAMATQGVTVPATADLQGALDTSIEDWEQQTGYEPFLSDGADETVYYTLEETDLLDLRGGFVSVTSVTFEGTLLILGTDYYLKRERKTGPYRYIKFASKCVSTEDGVKVIGDEGYASEVPAAVKSAILDHATEIALLNQMGGVGSLTREKAGPVEYDYDVAAGRATIDRLAASFASAVNQYARGTM